MTHYLINSPNKKVRPVMFLSMMVEDQSETQDHSLEYGHDQRTQHLQPMCDRSLRNCCARIARPRSGQTSAMRPFRA